jgi:hypothetical protein
MISEELKRVRKGAFDESGKSVEPDRRGPAKPTGGRYT